MSTINWLLLSGGDAALWLLDCALDMFLWLFATVDVVLAPVLTPLLGVLNPIATFLGDAVYAVLDPAPVWVGLAVISVVAGVVMLFAFKVTSNQKAIAKTKDSIKANLLALKLYRDELHVTFIAQWRLLKSILKLQWYMLKPVIILGLPMLIGIAQMGIRYQWRALKPNEAAQIKLVVDSQEEVLPPIELQAGDAFEVEAGPVPGGGEVWWLIRATEPGKHSLTFLVGGETVEKQLVVGEGLDRVSAERVRDRWPLQLLHPVERPIPSDSLVASIEVFYPGRESWFHGADYWILSFFVISMLAALVFAPVFKVRF